MIKDAENLNVADESGQTLGTLVLSTALSTLKWLLIIAALAATLFCCLFPYNAMAIYRSMGNHEKALEYCDACMDTTADKQGSEYSALLVNAITLSSTIISDITYETPYAKVDKEKFRGYAEKLASYTYTYKNLPVAVRQARSAAVDEYNIASSARSMHPLVYNFEAYARGKSVYAESLVNNTSASIMAIRDFIAQSGSAEDTVISAVELNAYIDFEIYRGAYSAEAPDSFTPERTAMFGFAGENDFKLIANGIGSAFSKTEGLGAVATLHALNTLAVLAENLSDAAIMYQKSKNVTFSTDTMELLENAKTVTIGDIEMPLHTYYYVLLDIYTNS